MTTERYGILWPPRIRTAAPSYASLTVSGPHTQIFVTTPCAQLFWLNVLAQLLPFASKL